MTDETQQAVIEDNGETGWEVPSDGREDDEKVVPESAEDFYRHQTIERLEQDTDRSYVERLELSHARLEKKLSETASPDAWKAQQEALRIVTEANEQQRVALEYTVGRVETLSVELAAAHTQADFTESELARAHGRAIDVTEALKTGKVEIVCLHCQRKNTGTFRGEPIG